MTGLLLALALAAGPAGYQPAAPDLMLGTAQAVPAPVREVARSWKWTTADYLREAAVLGLIAVDWRQTHNFRQVGVYELNPILGRAPSLRRVNLLIGSAMVLHVGVSAALPHGAWRTSWQDAVGGAEIAAVANNWMIGFPPLR